LVVKVLRGLEVGLTVIWWWKVLAGGNYGELLFLEGSL
jgi:hypothetical protein